MCGSAIGGMRRKILFSHNIFRALYFVNVFRRHGCKEVINLTSIFGKTSKLQSKAVSIEMICLYNYDDYNEDVISNPVFLKS